MQNNIKNSVLCGMSGGVDSSAAASLLLKLGFDVIGATMVLHNEGCDNKLNKDLDGAKKICERLNINHITLDLKQEFKEIVINDFIKKYEVGLTPNPCVECNRHLKFGLMFLKAKENGCEKIATGHYAKIEKIGDKFWLKKPKDLSKDQTYVLFMLTQKELKNTVFPLGDLTKAEVRELANNLSFENANNRDSQDICFVPGKDYIDFLKRNNAYYKKGDFININGEKIGTHQGIINYTIGQRKGLNVSFGKPMYVINKDSVNNTVTLGDNLDLFNNRVIIKNLSFTNDEIFVDGMTVFARLRYNANESKAKLFKLENNLYLLEFFEPQRAVTPGQYAVFYNEDICLGGGEIVN